MYHPQLTVLYWSRLESPDVFWNLWEKSPALRYKRPLSLYPKLPVLETLPWRLSAGPEVRPDRV